MSGHKPHWAYGLYATYNIYTKRWYAFKRDDANAYWNGGDCLVGSGSSANRAIRDYNEKELKR